jgi:hypothetical protein
MRRFVVLFGLLATVLTVVTLASAIACGPGDEKPPLTPDPATAPAPADDGGTPPLK